MYCSILTELQKIYTDRKIPAKLLCGMYIYAAYLINNKNISKTARELKISLKTVRTQLRMYGVYESPEEKNKALYSQLHA